MNSSGVISPCTSSVSSCCSRVLDAGSSWVSHGIAMASPDVGGLVDRRRYSGVALSGMAVSTVVVGDSAPVAAYTSG